MKIQDLFESKIHHDQEDEIQIMNGKKIMAKWAPRKKEGWILEIK